MGYGYTQRPRSMYDQQELCCSLKEKIGSQLGSQTLFSGGNESLFNLPLNSCHLSFKAGLRNWIQMLIISLLHQQLSQ